MEHSLAFLASSPLNSNNLNVELLLHVCCCIKYIVMQNVRVACVDRIRFTTNQMQKNRLQPNGGKRMDVRKNREQQSTVSQLSGAHMSITIYIVVDRLKSMCLCSYRTNSFIHSCHQRFHSYTSWFYWSLLIDRLFVGRICKVTHADHSKLVCAQPVRRPIE